MSQLTLCRLSADATLVDRIAQVKHALPPTVFFFFVDFNLGTKRLILEEHRQFW